MDLNHVKNLTETSAEVLLFDNIGSGTSKGQNIAQEVAYLVDTLEVKTILVRINSGGGSMVEGFGIYSALLAAKDKGVTVNVKIEGVAASMGFNIAMVGDKISMVDYGLMMLHDPHTGGGVVDAKRKLILDKFKHSAITIIANRTGKDKNYIDSLMGKETWMDSSEALEMGFIDEIIETSSKKQREEMKNALYEIQMSIYKPKKINMDKIINHFSLDAKATEDEIMNKISDLEGKIEAAKTVENSLNEKIEALEAAKVVAETKEMEASELVVTMVVENAIKGGKIKKDAKDSLIAKGKELGLEVVETLINSIEMPAVKLSTLIENNAEVEKRSFRELEKNDPSKLQDIKNNQPELYKKLYKAEYGVDIKL